MLGCLAYLAQVSTSGCKMLPTFSSKFQLFPLPGDQANYFHMPLCFLQNLSYHPRLIACCLKDYFRHAKNVKIM